MSNLPHSVTVKANANIALIKYWGKRDQALNLPATGSLSLTLDALSTSTTLSFDSALAGDQIHLNQQTATGVAAQRISHFLDLVHSYVQPQGGARPAAIVRSHNNFPTAAGLASSASGFAALALAASTALNAGLDKQQLSMLARRGSGSAARSIYGGIVEMAHGQREDGLDCIAHPLHGPEFWDLRVLIAITHTGAKKISSTDGMQQTTDTSPFYSAWVAGAENDLSDARQAIREKDFDALAAVTEFSTLKMHASALAARPGVLYWNAATVAAIHLIRELRSAGIPVCFTMDAGPQVKALCTADSVDKVSAALRQIAGVKDIIHCRLGHAARLINGD